jgi:hypothetical protein
MYAQKQVSRGMGQSKVRMCSEAGEGYDKKHTRASSETGEEYGDQPPGVCSETGGGYEKEHIRGMDERWHIRAMGRSTRGMLPEE